MPNSNRLAGKIVLVTGAGSGIGRSSAIRFAAEGASVLLLSRTAETGESAAEEARAAGGDALFLQTDVTVADQVEQAVKTAIDRWGRIDGLFNVAGISGRRFGDGPVDRCTEEGWDTVLDTNLKSIFLCCKYGVGAMLQSGGGAIVNLTSVLGIRGGGSLFDAHAYAASKGGIISLTKAMASYYAENRIRVNAIAPGLVETKMSRRAQDNPTIQSELKRLQPLTAGMGTADDVANAALYLLSDEASFVTGVVLPVDGGWLS
jgi:NAD(P)-dependent dehydrogenase (short-subunit alcohol dehydrogenase family)